MESADREPSTGVCSACGARFAKRGMARHLAACRRSAVAAGRPAGPAGLLLRVEGAYAPEYWMFLELRPDATWLDLDASLRHLWVECCWHLSDFELSGRRWLGLADDGGEVRVGAEDDWDEEDADEEDGESAAPGRPVAALVGPGDRLRYHYDFGSTTVLSLQVLVPLPSPGTESVTVLARNDPPHRGCDTCDAEATFVGIDGGAWYCDKCASAEDPEEGRLLPVVNSPRVGVCAYTGED